jgi:hypothetical protein
MEGFDYPALVRGALLGMVRGVLARATTEGLPGDHHFYLTFGTTCPGVGLPARLLKQHPDEMTLVLQHQFWNLAVDDGGFSVTLRFGGKPERVSVPWEALRVFVDPSVGFGLRLSPEGEPASVGTPEAAAEVRVVPGAESVAAPPGDSKVVDFGAYRRKDDGREGA